MKNSKIRWKKSAFEVLKNVITFFKDACTVKSRFKPVPPQLYLEFAALFLH